MKRQCGTCTKCCEGWLTTKVLGHKMYPGKPCHFISISKGCTIYAKRPKDPCVSFNCGWLENTDIPEWMNPNEINAIIKFDNIQGVNFMSVVEAGETLQSKVLSWLIQYAVNHKLNFIWHINGHSNWIGSPEFHQIMESGQSIDKSLHQEPNHLLPVVEAE
jgi:hypothetical protein